MKNFFSIVFATLLSTLLLVETVGVYITKDICDPCGTSSVAVEMVKLSEKTAECQHHHTEQQDQMAVSCCSDPAHHVPHDEEHHHHQEQHYLNNAPTFFSSITIQDFTPQELAILMPLMSILTENQEAQTLKYGDNPPPLITQLDSYRSFLCTYLI